MIVIVRPTGMLLTEPDRFDRFAVTLSGVALNALPDGVAADGPDHVWVQAAHIARHAAHGTDMTLEAWTAGFETMIEKVRPYGWVRDNPLAVRGHIETGAGEGTAVSS